MNLLHFRFISIILSSNDGDLNRFDGDRISIYTINILISSIYYIVLWIVFSLKLHYFFTIFHYFIVFASELSNAHISGLANVDPDFFLIKCFFKKLCIFPLVIIRNMRVRIRNHIDLCMVGITLYCFDIR